MKYTVYFAESDGAKTTITNFYKSGQIKSRDTFRRNSGQANKMAKFGNMSQFTMSCLVVASVYKPLQRKSLKSLKFDIILTFTLVSATISGYKLICKIISTTQSKVIF